MMSSFIQIFLHHDNPAENGASAHSVQDALQRFVDDVRAAGHQVTAQPTVNGQPVNVDTAHKVTGTPEDATPVDDAPNDAQKGT
jgi:hypothetical protein